MIDGVFHRDRNGLPPNLNQFVRESDYADPHGQAVDPSHKALAREIAKSIRDVRPIVTLPPNTFMPWRGVPFLVETRFIIDQTSNITINGGSTNAGNAEGLTVFQESAQFDTTNAGKLTVPSGMIAVIRKWGAQTDDLGYWHDASGPLVQFILSMGGDQSQFPIGLEGNTGKLDRPFEVSHVVPQSLVIAVKAQSRDTTMWHLVETFMSGYLIRHDDINETLTSLGEQI